jgi:hypothetical protein
LLISLRKFPLAAPKSSKKLEIAVVFPIFNKSGADCGKVVLEVI